MTPARVTRVFRFYVVGLLGIGVQLASLRLHVDGVGMYYIISTALAVEIAVIHNFCWHDRWTWPARRCSRAVRLQRFWRFNLSVGIVSIFTNLVVTGALVESAGLSYMIANLAAISAGSVVTFILGEVFVFMPSVRTGNATSTACCAGCCSGL